jgi:hypothetical protein
MPDIDSTPAIFVAFIGVFLWAFCEYYTNQYVGIGAYKTVVATCI